MLGREKGNYTANKDINIKKQVISRFTGSTGHDSGVLQLNAQSRLRARPPSSLLARICWVHYYNVLCKRSRLHREKARRDIRAEAHKQHLSKQ